MNEKVCDAVFICSMFDKTSNICNRDNCSRCEVHKAFVQVRENSSKYIPQKESDDDTDDKMKTKCPLGEICHGCDNLAVENYRTCTLYKCLAEKFSDELFNESRYYRDMFNELSGALWKGLARPVLNRDYYEDPMSEMDVCRCTIRDARRAYFHKESQMKTWRRVAIVMSVALGILLARIIIATI